LAKKIKKSYIKLILKDNMRLQKQKCYLFISQSKKLSICKHSRNF